MAAAGIDEFGLHMQTLHSLNSQLEQRQRDAELRRMEEAIKSAVLTHDAPPAPPAAASGSTEALREAAIQRAAGAAGAPKQAAGSAWFGW